MSGIFTKDRIISELNKTLFNTSFSYYFSPIADKIFPANSFSEIKAIVKALRKERKDILSLDLKPGRKFRHFIPGQYIEVKIKINGVTFSRIFSISSSYEKFRKEGIITLTIQQQKEGKVTTHIHKYIKVGDTIEISEAMGDFTLKNKNEQDVLFIAGGSGITPFRSMLYQSLSLNNTVTLLYYCNHDDEHIFKDELLTFNTKQIKVHLIDSSQKGFISFEHLQTYCSDFKNKTIFICGPAPMIDATVRLLEQNNIDNNQIIIERFRPAVVLDKIAGNIKGNILVKNLNNKTIEVVGNSSILESLEKNGIFPKYGCRMGICKKCQCTKKSGVVYDKNTQKFSEATEEKITICVTVPVNNVELEF